VKNRVEEWLRYGGKENINLKSSVKEIAIQITKLFEKLRKKDEKGAM